MLQSLKSRMMFVLILSVVISHIISLWIYARKHDEAATLLQDTLLAERIALVAHILERTPPQERGDVARRLNTALVKVAAEAVATGVQSADAPALTDSDMPDSRPHLFEHLLGLFLDRPSHAGIRSEHQPLGPSNLLAALSTELDPGRRRLPEDALRQIFIHQQVTTTVRLSDGGIVSIVNPWLAVGAFSPAKVWLPFTAVLISVLLSGAFVIARTTRPLSELALAARRFGMDMRAEPLAEAGAVEVRSASRAFNAMQERIARLIEDRTAFATALAHDIGTPLTRLLLRLEELPATSTKSSIEKDIDQMQRMVKATLDFARADYRSERAEVVDVVALVRRIAVELVTLEASVELAFPLSLFVYTKPLWLRRAITNLTDNAIKYGRNARIEVRKSAGGDLIEIVIEDEGPGIPPALQEEAFRPFRRLVERSDQSPNGSGLGLSIARSFARSLGGDVILENRNGKGLRAILSIPNLAPDKLH